jgi:polysaccharide deacetylase family protein (PEP-CTERM system associated)
MGVVDYRQAIRNDLAGGEAERPAASGFASVEDLYRGRQLPNAMTVDVEDYFQVSAFEDVVSRDDWSGIPSRLPANIDRILRIFGRENVKATFFTLGWVCEKFPGIIRDIASAGHEIASHGFEHSRVGTFDAHQFRQDVETTRKMLEDVSGTPVIGYRAPSFSIGADTLWAHEVLAAAGYQYSSSVFPVRHDHYGLPGAPRFPFRTGAASLLEIPLSSLPLFGRNLPCAGGGYFRLLPLAYSKWAIRRINRREQMPAIFYFHPWELDPDQPRVEGISAKTRFRHYVNLHRFESRLTSMLRAFRWDRMDRIFLERV